MNDPTMETTNGQNVVCASSDDVVSEVDTSSIDAMISDME